jgi:hypothetical protein
MSAVCAGPCSRRAATKRSLQLAGASTGCCAEPRRRLRAANPVLMGADTPTPQNPSSAIAGNSPSAKVFQLSGCRPSRPFPHTIHIRSPHTTHHNPPESMLAVQEKQLLVHCRPNRRRRGGLGNGCDSPADLPASGAYTNNSHGHQRQQHTGTPCTLTADRNIRLTHAAPPPVSRPGHPPEPLSPAAAGA